MQSHGIRRHRGLGASALACAALAGTAAGAPTPPPAAPPARAAAALDGGDARVEATLLADPGDADRGLPARVGLRFDLDPGWHLYWRNPGASGLPTRVRFRVDGGATMPVAWPAPVAFGELAEEGRSYGYADTVVLASEVSRTPGSPPPARVRAEAELVACANKCVPASFSLSRPFPQSPDPAVRAELDAWAERLPAPPGGRGLEVAARYSQSAVRPGDSFEGSVAVRCRTPSRCAGLGSSPASVAFFPDRIEGVEIEPAGILRDPADPRTWLATFTGRAAAEAVTPGDRLRGVLSVEDAAGRSRSVEIDLPLPRAPAGAAVTRHAGRGRGPAQAAPAANRPGLAQALALALLGGIVLNLMPCVLPVLAIKLVALAELAHRRRRAVVGHVLAYTAGIGLTQLLLAGLVVGLRAAGIAVGWGFQFQEPLFLAGIGTLLVVFALNLFGVFEIQLVPARLAGVGAGATGARRSFFEGLLAVALATPCSAPFLGTAVGFAFASSAAVVAAIFLAIGLGLALPFALVAFVPGWARHLPRSGPWMGELRAGLGFALLATVAWLLWLLGRNAGADAAASLVAGFVALAFAARLYGVAQRRGHAGARALAGVAAVVLALGSLDAVRIEARESRADSELALRAQPFDAARLHSVLQEGGRAFVYFTADWCLTCKVNERRVLSDVRLQTALDLLGYEVFRADWTHRDEVIRAELARFGRASVPLYVLYRGLGQTTVLPELLDLDDVLAALGAS